MIKIQKRKYAKEFFRSIALILRRFLNAESFCGNLINQIFVVLFQMSVTFPFASVIVGLLVNDHIQQMDLSIDLKYFFSNIFIEHIVDPLEMRMLSTISFNIFSRT
jgi:hypothetical protein